MKSLMLAVMVLSSSNAPAQASDTAEAARVPPHASAAEHAPANESDDRPFVWPTVRYGWPEKWSAGAALQPRLPGVLNRLIVSGTVGAGGHKVGLGYGGFGGTIMGGAAVHVTLLRTSSHPRGAEPHQTFIGVEPQIMLANWSFKGGPAVRVGGRTPSADRFRINFSLGLGF